MASCNLAMTCRLPCTLLHPLTGGSTTSPVPPAPLTWEDRGTADGRVAGWSPGGSPANRSPPLLTAVGVCADSSPSFTTTNPIIYKEKESGDNCSSKSIHIETSLAARLQSSISSSRLDSSITSRGRADGGHEDDVTCHTDPAESRHSSPPTSPDSDFDDFDSNEEGGLSGEDKPINSQDNEIQEIYYQVNM